MGNNGDRAQDIVLTALEASPEEQWQHLRSFLNLAQADLDAMAQTVEVLLRRGPDFVVGAYDYLLRFKETAEVLGWERGADPVHLAERRRFFTIWYARTIGMDLSDDLARYLFRAGKFHAAHGPRRIHTPEIYVTGAISLAQASFAGYLADEITDAGLVARALTGWNKLLTMHLHLMSAGYRAALAVGEGDFDVSVAFYGRLRDLAGRDAMTLRLAKGSQTRQLLHKFFNYLPDARGEALVESWDDTYRVDDSGTPWLTTHKVYRPRRDWNLRLNGRNLEYGGGLERTVNPGDELSIFPPGR
jgi:molybdopterin converting factor small subunit